MSKIKAGPALPPVPPEQCRGLYLRLLGYVKPYWKIFVGGLVAMAVYSAAESAVPALTKLLLDGSFVAKDATSAWLIPLLLVGVFIVRGLSDYIHTTALNYVAHRVVLDLRVQMFDRLLHMPASFYESQPSGSLLSKLTYDVQQLSPIVTVALITLVKDSLIVLGLLGYMLYENWRLSLAFFLVLPVIAVVIRTVSHRLRSFSRAQQNSMGSMTDVLDEVIGGHKEIKIFGSERYESQRFFGVANSVRRNFMKVVATSAANGPIVQSIVALAMAFIIYYAALQSQQDEITVGGFVSFFGAAAMLLSPIKRLTNVNEHLQRGLAAAGSVFALLDTPVEPDHGQDGIRRAKGHLEFHDVSFRYPNAESDAVHRVNLEIKPGETVALVGASGSGKSTLMALIPRFYQPSSGKITLDGIDINDLKLAELRANLGLVTQHVVLFNDTIAANIAYGRPDVSEEDIRRAAEAAHAMEFIDKLPQGLHTPIGENGARLSGGQRQRLSIARALLKDAPILLLDEATSALDTESERAVQAALDNLRRGRTTIMIAHRLSTILNADRIVVLDGGRIAEIGTHQELLAKNGIYSRLYRLQFSQEQEAAHS